MLFDALNCGTLSDLVMDQLNNLIEGRFSFKQACYVVIDEYFTIAMAARDPQRAMAVHVDLLMRGSWKNDIGWMFMIKQHIMHL